MDTEDTNELESEQLESEGQGAASQAPTLEERFKKIEADLIAQDHRALPVLRNFGERRQWGRADPRYRASRTALLWWCLGGMASPTGFAVGLAAVLTLALTGWNAWEFRRQNEALTEQNATLKRQVDQQAADTLIVRRAQLLATIYEEDCKDVPIEGSDPPSTERKCEPRFHLRARQEAVIAFVEIERSRGEAANLTAADLAGAHFLGIDLSEVILMAADLSDALLFSANLTNTDLLGADFGGASLDRADLTGARDLKQDQIESAYGDHTTRLPEGLNYPTHWPQFRFDECIPLPEGVDTPGPGICALADGTDP